MAKAAALDRRLSAEAFRVLGVLYCYADATSHCCPSIPTIAAHLALTRRMVQLHIRRLEELGYVTTTRQKRTVSETGRRRNGARLGGGWAPSMYTLIYPAPPSLKWSDKAKPDFTSSGTDNAKFGDTDNAKWDFAQTRKTGTRKSLEEEDSVYQEETHGTGAGGQRETGLHVVERARQPSPPANGKLPWHTPTYEIVELAEPKPEPTPSDINAQIARLRAEVEKLA
jgi:hypothetical protein